MSDRTRVRHHDLDALGTMKSQSEIESVGKSMFDDGIAKALAGVTTIEEIMRVTREI